ncbi:DUF692 domain-containing protein [Burkholderia sp. Bp8992]|uniref:MNIO family bufferin maturase n=1 Tax=Burkholderia sp. Bp8992 TaxID=2184554 RepID=UPI000F58CE0E|nr:DUF692 domain-containing protein [Burkholderia sp. Bp8992]RQS25294.1 DUF692 domain-containing protein [Burkholderia sp. Bp8992]
MGLHQTAHAAGRGLPACAGVGLKADHYRVIIETLPDIGFLEVHAENYMGAGGPPHRYLTAIREHYPLSLHGVGLSIGADGPLDHAHLQRLKALNARYEPALFSEHLAWSSHGNRYLGDLLPVPYTDDVLHRVCRHIDQVQMALNRQMLLENPSTYLRFEASTWCETDFIREIAQRTGCGLLLDVNNAYVSSTNQAWDAHAYIDDFPLDHVQQIHLAGHARRTDEQGRPLLIDSHDQCVDEPVWNLFRRVIERIGPVPTLIERDANVPAWPELQAEAVMAETLMGTSSTEERRHGTRG